LGATSSSLAVKSVSGAELAAKRISLTGAPDPMGFYGMCKLYSEYLAALYSRRFKLETVGLRPTSVFGVGRGARGSWASGVAAPMDVHYMMLPELAALGPPI
jgi:nucleoside-diphosphate-sugar epimerase